jgi:hypothetical protein
MAKLTGRWTVDSINIRSSSESQSRLVGAAKNGLSELSVLRAKITPEKPAGATVLQDSFGCELLAALRALR